MKILIVENEAIVAQNLADIIESFGFKDITIVYNEVDALNLLQISVFDIILLDIRLDKAYEGFNIAQYININTISLFIFITAFSDKVLIDKAISFMPLGYITKPFKESEIYSLLKIAQNKIDSRQEDYYLLQVGTSVERIRFNDILYFKSDNNYVDIIIEEKKYVERNTLENILKKLPNNFVRVHRSYVVNMSKIKTLKNNQLIVKNERIPVSRKYKEFVIDTL
jgi:DNA-binding LytR/AlgR family response regulator